jgi:hypothetical protein
MLWDHAHGRASTPATLWDPKLGRAANCVSRNEHRALWKGFSVWDASWMMIWVIWMMLLYLVLRVHAIKVARGGPVLGCFCTFF